MANEAIRFKAVLDAVLDRTLTNQEAIDFGSPMAWYLGGSQLGLSAFNALTNDQKAFYVLDAIKLHGKDWLRKSAEMDVDATYAADKKNAGDSAADSLV